MKDQERALKVFREIATFNYPVAFERRPSDGKRYPADYAVSLAAGELGTSEIARVAKIAKKEDLDMSIVINGKRPFMVLR